MLAHFFFPLGDKSDGLTPEATRRQALAADPWTPLGWQEAQQRATEQSRLLLVYLWSPLGRSIPVPHHESYIAVGYSTHTAQGRQLAQFLGVTTFPALALIQPLRHQKLQLLLRAQGPTLLATNLLSDYLAAARATHEHRRAEQLARQLQQEEEALLRRQQDEEYQQALLADQERERQREVERRAVLEAERIEQERVEQEAQAEANALAEAQARVREEPASGGTMVRFVLPSGAKINRRFYSDETIGALQAFLKVHFTEQSIPIQRVSLSTNFPRKTYTDEEVTLDEAGLSPQAVLMVQDLDA